MHEYVYLVFNLVVFLPVLVLSIITDVRPHRQLKALLGAYALVSLPFAAWDALAVHRSFWYFNGHYTLVARFLHMPFEELFFFITVPFAMMYVWGVVKKYIDKRALPLAWVLGLMIVAAAGTATFLVLSWGKEYATAASLTALFAICVAACTQLIYSRRFWVFQLVLLAIFILANWLLTALPIISYNSAAITGVHVLTIPIEDFFFNFAFINLFLIVFTWLSKPDSSVSR